MSWQANRRVHSPHPTPPAWPLRSPWYRKPKVRKKEVLVPARTASSCLYSHHANRAGRPPHSSPITAHASVEARAWVAVSQLTARSNSRYRTPAMGCGMHWNMVNAWEVREGYAMNSTSAATAVCLWVAQKARSSSTNAGQPLRMR